MDARFAVIEARRWRNRHNGATRLTHQQGPAPDGIEWVEEACGWTIKDRETGEIGFGREPFAEQPDAESFAAYLNAIPSLNWHYPPPIKPAVPQPPPPAEPATLAPEQDWLI